MKLLVIVGPTASGKTALACALAERLSAEIISADSQQCYRGLDAGTAKPSPEERGKGSPSTTSRLRCAGQPRPADHSVGLFGGEGVRLPHGSCENYSRESLAP